MTSKALEACRAVVLKYRKALEVYANGDNWGPPRDNGACRWLRVGDDGGWELAQKALQ